MSVSDGCQRFVAVYCFLAQRSTVTFLQHNRRALQNAGPIYKARPCHTPEHNLIVTS